MKSSCFGDFYTTVKFTLYSRRILLTFVLKYTNTIRIKAVVKNYITFSTNFYYIKKKVHPFWFVCLPS